MKKYLNNNCCVNCPKCQAILANKTKTKQPEHIQEEEVNEV